MIGYLPISYINHFGDEPPSNPFEGMIWFDTASDTLVVYRNGSWSQVSSNNFIYENSFIFIGTQPPQEQNILFWLDISNPNQPVLKYKHRNTWISISGDPGNLPPYSQTPAPNNLVQALNSGHINPNWIEDNTLSGNKLLDDSVSGQKLADNSISTQKIQNNAITTDKIADDSITTSKIRNNAITTSKIADNAVTTSKIQDGAITESKLANNSISTNKIQNQAITTDKLHPSIIAPNSNALQGYTPSINPAPNTIPVSDTNGNININWLANNSITSNKLASNSVDTNHLRDNSITTSKIQNSAVTTEKIANGAITTDKIANDSITLAKINSSVYSVIPSPNRIPLADNTGRIAIGWLPDTFSAYSRIQVGSNLPTTGINEGDLFYRTSDNKLFIRRIGNWLEVDWQRLVQASPEWIAGRLRIQNGQLQISPDGTNWFNCIPAVGASAVELVSVDNTNYTILYWIPPGVTAIVRSANHLPIVYAKDIEPVFSGTYWHSTPYESWIGLRPSNIAISNGDGQNVSGINSSPAAARDLGGTATIVPIAEHGIVNENWAHFSLNIRSNQRWLVTSIGQGHGGFGVSAAVCSGTAAIGSYWLGTWWTEINTSGYGSRQQFTMTRITITRLA